MIPYVDLSVANNNFYASRDGWEIDTIMIHSMAGTWQSANGRFNNPAAQVSAHRGICYDGINRRWVEDQFTAYANGVWTVNLRALSIEAEDMGRSWEERPDIIYSQAGAQCAEWATMYPKIKLDRLHIVPGAACHRDVKATACPAGLDFERIIWIARLITEGGTPVAEFDPINNPAHRQWLDDRYATNATVDTMKKVYNPVAAWAASAPHPPAFTPEVMRLLGLPVQPDSNQKGEPPEGHPAHEPRAGIHTPRDKAGKED